MFNIEETPHLNFGSNISPPEISHGNASDEVTRRAVTSFTSGLELTIPESRRVCECLALTVGGTRIVALLRRNLVYRTAGGLDITTEEAVVFNEEGFAVRSRDCPSEGRRANTLRGGDNRGRGSGVGIVLRGSCSQREGHKCRCSYGSVSLLTRVRYYGRFSGSILGFACCSGDDPCRCGSDSRRCLSLKASANLAQYRNRRGEKTSEDGRLTNWRTNQCQRWHLSWQDNQNQREVFA